MSNQILETERLSIEEVNKKDCSFIFKLLNSPSWLEHIGDRGIKTTSDALNYILDLQKGYQENGFGLYKMVLKDSKEPIGICGFLKRDYLEFPDIGFAICSEHEGLGYAFEATYNLLKYASVHLSINEVLAITTQSNKPSQSLLEKLGFTRKGYVTPPDGKEKLLLYANH